MSKRPITTLFLLESLDGKISSGNTDELDADKDWCKIDGVKEGLHQYYEIESTTDYFSLNTGRVMAKIGVNDRKEYHNKVEVKFVIVDNKPHLNENGIVITNIISSLEGNDADFIKYEYSTYKAVFDNVKVFQVNTNHANDQEQNLILVGIKGNENININKEEEYNALLSNEIKDFMSDKPIVTDDYAPIGD